MKLYEGACAYVEAAGSAVTAVEGANFRVAVREGRAVVDPASGEVEVSSIIRSQDAPDKIRVGELKAGFRRGIPIYRISTGTRYYRPRIPKPPNASYGSE